MTIKTITDLIHEYLYDRLNELNNSNDGRETTRTRTTVQKKWSDKSGTDRPRKKPDYERTKYRVN